MSYKNLNQDELEKLASQSFIETLVSGYETIQSWSRPIHISGKKIFLEKLSYWNVVLQEPYYSYVEASQKREELSKKN